MQCLVNDRELSAEVKTKKQHQAAKKARHTSPVICICHTISAHVQDEP